MLPDALALPVLRYEVVRGALLVSPAPRLRHQVLVARLVRFLQDYLKPLGLVDSVLTAPADITWGLTELLSWKFRDAERELQIPLTELFAP